MNSDNCEVAVIYQAYGREDYNEYDDIFFESYKKHPAGTKHRLFIAAKGYKNNLSEYKSMKTLAAGNNASVIDLPDDGMEFGAFYRVAKAINFKYIFCIVASGFVLKDNWLKFFLDAANNNQNYKLLGPSGSYENIFPGIIIKLRNLIKSSLAVSANPNPHIRTSCFFIDRVIYINWLEKSGFPKDKRNSFILESGKKSLTKYIEDEGFNFAVVGADGKCYQTKEWDKSKTFRQPDLSNLIIADKQYSHYLDSDIDTKMHLEKLAWGYSITQQEI